MSGTITAVPTINGRCWTWTHEGIEYQAVHFTGATRVRLYDRFAGREDGWLFCRSEPIDGFTARGIVAEMYGHITGDPSPTFR